MIRSPSSSSDSSLTQGCSGFKSLSDMPRRHGTSPYERSRRATAPHSDGRPRTAPVSTSAVRLPRSRAFAGISAFRSADEHDSATDARESSQEEQSASPPAAARPPGEAGGAASTGKLERGIVIPGPYLRSAHRMSLLGLRLDPRSRQPPDHCRLSFALRFSNARAEAAVFRHTYYCGNLTGELNIMDILLYILLFVEVDQSTLLAISGVSLGWRAASENLGQWCFVPQLFHPNPATLQNFGLDLNADLLGVNVTNRESYLEVMCRRWHLRRGSIINFTEQRRTLKRRERFPQVVVLVQFFTALVLCMVPLTVAGVFGIMCRHDSGPDLLLAVIAWTLATFGGHFPLVINETIERTSLTNTAGLSSCRRTNRGYNLRYKGHYSFVALTFLIVILLPGPFASLTVRSAVADDMLNAPQVTYGYGPGECTNTSAALGWSNWPTYVRIADPWDWHIEPWMPGQNEPSFRSFVLNSSTGVGARTYRDLPQCRVPAASGFISSNWWGDAYLRRGGSMFPALEPWEQCYDVFVPGPPTMMRSYAAYPLDMRKFVVLVPPAKLVAACPSTRPIAMPYAPDEDDFNRSVAAFFISGASQASGAAVRAAPAGQLTTFRSLVRSARFDLPPYALDLAHAWFNSTFHGHNASKILNETRWAHPDRIERAYLWERQRMAIVLPLPAQMAPEELARRWQGWVDFVPRLVIFVLLFNVIMCMLPRRLMPASMWVPCVTYMVVCFCNPVTIGLVGLACLTHPSAELCLITPTESWVIIWFCSFATVWLVVLCRRELNDLVRSVLCNR